MTSLGQVECLWLKTGGWDIPWAKWGKSWTCLSGLRIGDQHHLQLRSLFPNLLLQRSKKDSPCDLIWCKESVPTEGGWIQMVFNVLSNPKHSVSLQIYESMNLWNRGGIALLHSAQLGNLFSILVCFGALSSPPWCSGDLCSSYTEHGWSLGLASPSRVTDWATPWLTSSLTCGEWRLPSVWAGGSLVDLGSHGGLRYLFRHQNSFQIWLHWEAKVCKDT